MPPRTPSSWVSGEAAPLIGCNSGQATNDVQGRGDYTIFTPTSPSPVGALHKTVVAPPATETFLNLLPAKNATPCPSGEKKGAEPPSVPESSVACC